MGIMVLLSAIMLPMVAPLVKNKALDTSVRTITGAVYKARSLAAMHNSNYFVSFNTYNALENMVVIYDSDSTGKVADTSKITITAKNFMGPPWL